MRRCLRIGLKLGCLTLLIANGVVAIAQPEEVESSGGGVVQAEPSGTAQAGTAVSGPGKLVRVHPGRANDMQNINKLDGGSPSSDEKTAIERVLPGAHPRKLIVDFTSKFSKHAGPPFLQSGTLLFLDDAFLKTAFPGRLFYVLRFRQWPIGFAVPEPMRSNNIFTLDKKGGLKLITDLDELKQLFQLELHRTKNSEAQTAVAGAWLRLQEELAQDGMFQFAPAKFETAASPEGTAVTAIGGVNPNGGNIGELTARLVFSSTGAITSIDTTNNLKAGMRPICQSTKLLDPDPIVRKMAEQDLLIMGKFAKPYLDDQRTKVSPDLQKAIDEIWARIEKEDRYR